MSLLGWRQWAVDRDGLLRPAWTPWSPFPAGLLLWRPDGLTRAYCLRDTHPADVPSPGTPPRQSDRNQDEPRGAGGGPVRRGGDGGPVTAAGLPRRPVGDAWAGVQRGDRPADAALADGASTDSASGGAADPGSNPVPAAECVCGLYAWRDPEILTASPIPRWTRRPIVVGAVRLGGRIIVGERGYRAELGYPVAIHDPNGVIAPSYQVARYRDWDALVAEWRPEAPSAAA